MKLLLKILNLIAGLSVITIFSFKASDSIDYPESPKHYIVDTPNHSWRAIQDKISNTVVQVFTQKAQFDFFQPFRTPDQSTRVGSRFLINQKGEIVTNWHVVDQARA